MARVGVGAGAAAMARCAAGVFSMTAAILSGHRLVRPHGLAGGAAGEPGKNYVLRIDGRRTELGPFDQTEMAAGDVFVIESPGGGGYGTIE